MTTNVIASVETKSNFQLRQVIVKAQSNEALFKTNRTGYKPQTRSSDRNSQSRCRRLAILLDWH